MLFSKQCRHQKLPPTRGFTLIELMVSMSIIVLVTGLALVRYGAFNNTILLKSQALELALDIRQAQVSSVSVSVESGSIMAERDGYGVFVSTAASESQVYGLFRDDNNNSRFDSGEQIGEDYYLDPRFKIYQICDQSNACNLTSASISFHRPNFDARLYVGSTSKTRIDIVLAAVDDTSVTRTVSVYSSGQITVE